jgi:hypothetical protein
MVLRAGSVAAMQQAESTIQQNVLPARTGAAAIPWELEPIGAPR